MQSRFLKIVSLFLTVLLLVNMLPMSVFAAEFQEALRMEGSNNLSAVSASAPTYVVEELIEKRTAYSKEFLLSNGLHMATVYGDAVHYETEKGWEEIDNTLKVQPDGTLVNTAGAWDVTLPGRLDEDSAIRVEKDGYALSFRLDGELNTAEAKQTLGLAVAEPRTEHQARAEEKVGETFALSRTRSAQAQVQEADVSAMLEAAEHPEMVPQKNQSRVAYTEVYENTDILYDLEAETVKESVVLKSYSPALRGYRYTLESGEMVPVLEESGQITFCTPDGKTAVLVMPAPFLVDDAGVRNEDVLVELAGSDGTYTVTYLLPEQWLAEEDRAWPVVLDPAVTPAITTRNILDQTITENSDLGYEWGYLAVGRHPEDGISRAVVKFDQLPNLTSSDVIVSATVRMRYTGDGTSNITAVEVHAVENDWTSSQVTRLEDVTFRETAEDYDLVGEYAFANWVVTDIVRGWYTGRNTGMLFKADAIGEAGTGLEREYKQFCSSDYSDYNNTKPYLTITFRNNNGLESYWDYTTADAGRAGTGAVNNFTGNMTWIRSDLGFGGNLMPVSIAHVYNLNDAVIPSDSNNSNDTGGNAFGMGLGWRTNYNELLYRWVLDGQQREYYIWEDSDGTDHYFEQKDGQYRDEDGLELTLTVNGSGTQTYRIEDKYGNYRYFDSYGRLTVISNNQQTTSNITVSYTTDTGRKIASVTDGAGRVYRFSYGENGLCSKIEYYGTKETPLAQVSFAYTGDKLTRVTDRDGGFSTYSYNEAGLLADAQDIDGYKLSYEYNDVSPDTPWQPYRVKSVTEHHNSEDGGKLTFQYDHNQTTVTDSNGNVQILQFNDFGDTVCIQDSEGRAQFCEYAFRTDKQKDENEDATAKGHQLRAASDLQYTTASLMRLGHMSLNEYNFSDMWEIYGLAGVQYSTYCYADSDLLIISPFNEDESGGIISIPFEVPAHQTQTFSCYVKPRTTSVFLMVQCDGETKVSETEPAEYKWQRMQISYTNESDQPKQVRYCVMGTAAGDFFMDCAQVENAPIASRYNLISNGDFNFGELDWNRSGVSSRDGVTTLADTAAPQLDSTVYKIVGSPYSDKGLTQKVRIYGKEGDSLVLSGWAKGNAAPLVSFDERPREFGLVCTVNYTDQTKETFTAQFNPDSDQWQYSAVAIRAKKDYHSVTVRLAYDYNVNTVYFDGIQLNKDEFANTFTYDEDGNVVSAVNAAGERTDYEYTGNDLTKELLPGDVELTYEYDTYHNVTKATTQEGLVYEFSYDAYGNNTQVSVENAGKTMHSSATYTEDGNRLLSVTDAQGGVTQYGYQEDTNLLQWVQLPGEHEADRTNYSYDNMGRLLEATKANGGEATPLSVAYGYENDQLETVTTPTTQYRFTYGQFGLRAEVSAGGQTLASYIYSEDGNNYLERLVYGNHDVVKYTRDDQGRVIQETFGEVTAEGEGTADSEAQSQTEPDLVTYTYDASGSLATVYDSESGITASYVYDLTDRLHKYLETGTGHSMMLRYNYDEENRLSTVRESINGWSRLSRYTYDDDNRLTVFQKAYGFRNYTYDAFNRVTQTTTKDHDTQVLKTEYSFNDTETTVSGQVKEVAHTYASHTEADLTYSYTYDDKGNILTVSDGTNTTGYVYDRASQLIRENNQAGNFTYVWKYDNAGNILSRTEYAYTTGELGTPTDTVLYGYRTEGWRDVLTSYDGQTIVSDEIGNITDDGNRSYTWKNGRELDTVTDDGTTWSMTYNADGMRVKRTDSTTVYSYVYDGGTLLRMKKGSEHMMFAHSPDGVPLSVVYDDLLYYYVTNLQGDVVAILDATGAEVVTYTYDAWGNIRTIGGSKATTLGQDNPLRYRGYVYDQETGLYYLQSRYYDPTLGRFINADNVGTLDCSPASLLHYNIFAYCWNNPINMADDGGCLPFFVISGVACALIGGVLGYATTGSWKGALAGVAIGGLIGTVGGAVTAKILVGSAAAKLGAVAIAGKFFLGTVVSGILNSAEEISQKVGSVYRTLTQYNFRYNLQKLTGFFEKGMQAHHIFPQKFESMFLKAGINIHNPLFGAWVDSTHQFWSSNYNRDWAAFFKAFENPTAQQIFEKVVELAKKYGFSLNF